LKPRNSLWFNVKSKMRIVANSCSNTRRIFLVINTELLSLIYLWVLSYVAPCTYLDTTRNWHLIGHTHNLFKVNIKTNMARRCHHSDAPSYDIASGSLDFIVQHLTWSRINPKW